MVEWGADQDIAGVRRNHPPPEIPLYFAPYLKTFQDLYWDRNNGLGRTGGIPLRAILDYADRIEPQNLEDFIDILQTMDRTYLNKIAEKK